MTKVKWMWAGVVLVSGAMLVTSGASAASSMGAATRPATTKPSAMNHRRKIPKPFSEMTSLTPQQQDQIAKIHEDAIDQEKKMREKEMDDESALLTPEQQTELNDIQGKAKETQKEKYASHKKAATQPSK